MTVDASGALFHARYAFMPNKLGFCGPDDSGKILEHLQDSSVDEKLLSILKNFEAAYPFVRLIAESTGREPFDYEVAEAYWIGNELLEKVLASRFYRFALGELKNKNREETRALFRNWSNLALPHHTFYVLNTAMSVISNSHHTSADSPKKIAETIDNCRISLGRVVKVKEDSLTVMYKPLRVKDRRVEFAAYTPREVKYDRQLPRFDKIAPGMHVSMHWDFACQVLSENQVKNIRAYTKRDVDSTNLFLDAVGRA